LSVIGSGSARSDPLMGALVFSLRDDDRE
jgi:hypothetical protein